MRDVFPERGEPHAERDKSLTTLGTTETFRTDQTDQNREPKSLKAWETVNNVILRSTFFLF